MPFIKKNDAQSHQPRIDPHNSFIGRTDELHFFRQNILTPEDPTYNILSISGQGGVGKSTLLARFIDEAHSPTFKDYCLTTIVDERQTTPVRMMEVFADQLRLKGKFERELGQYKETLRRLQTEQYPMQETMLHNLPDFAGAAVEIVPLAGSLLREGVKAGTKHLVGRYHADQIRRDAELLGDPLTALTRVFAEELNRLTDTYVTLRSRREKRQRRVLLFFDTFEQLAVSAVPWLLNYFLPAPISSNVVLVIAGRDSLDHSLPDDPKGWLPYYDRGDVYSMPLKSFTEDEARAYLAGRAITDPTRVATIWQLSRGLPLYLGFLTANPSGEVDPTEDVIVNFLRWIPEQEVLKRKLALDAALFSAPFNQDDLVAFPSISEQERSPLFRWLTRQPFVLRQDGRYRYHDVAQELFSRHLFLRSPKEYTLIRRALADHYQQSLEEAQRVGDKGVDRTDEWLELTIALAHQLLLLPDEVSHCRAMVQVLKAIDYLGIEEPPDEMAKFLRELSREQSTNLAIPGARQVAEQLLHYIEAKRAGQKRLSAITAMLEKAVLLPSFPTEMLAYLYSQRGWESFYLRLKNYQQAITDFEHALQLDPRCASAYNGRGWAYLNLDQYQQAKADFDRAIESDPNTPGAYNGRGSMYRELKEHQQAKADFDRFIKVAPKNAWAYVQHGRTCIDLKEYQQAIADFERALQLNPYYTAAYEGLRQVYVELKEHQQAEIVLERLRRLHPESSKAYTQRGWTYWSLKEYQQAIADFDHALDLDPDQVLSYGGRGWAYRRLKEYQRAIADFSCALEFDPNYGAAYNGLGSSYRELKEYQLAITNFNRFIEIAPNNYWAYFQRGHTLLFLKDIGQAMLDFAQSGELASGDARGSWMAEWSGMCQGKDHTTTPERLEVIAAIKPEDTTAHICRGVALWLRGRFEESMAELEQAILLDPEQWDPFFWKGMTHASLRQDEEAILAVEKALDLGLPPILLAPLRWFEHERPDFYEKHVVPLLAKHV